MDGRTAQVSVEACDNVLTCSLGPGPDEADMMIRVTGGGQVTVANDHGEAFPGKITDYDLDECTVTVVIGEPS